MSQELETIVLPSASVPLSVSACASSPLIEELTPTPDPWQVCRRLAHLPHVLYLDSASGPAELGRYSYVTAQPFAWLQSRGGQVWLNGEMMPQSDPFRVLAEQLQRLTVDTVADVPPFQGGAAGLVGYDLCHHLERLP